MRQKTNKNKTKEQTQKLYHGDSQTSLGENPGRNSSEKIKYKTNKASQRLLTAWEERCPKEDSLVGGRAGSGPAGGPVIRV